MISIAREGNILVYLAGVNKSREDEDKISVMRVLIRRLQKCDADCARVTVTRLGSTRKFVDAETENDKTGKC